MASHMPPFSGLGIVMSIHKASRCPAHVALSPHMPPFSGLGIVANIDTCTHPVGDVPQVPPYAAILMGRHCWSPGAHFQYVYHQGTLCARQAGGRDASICRHSYG